MFLDVSRRFKTFLDVVESQAGQSVDDDEAEQQQEGGDDLSVTVTAKFDFRFLIKKIEFHGNKNEHYS
jgi:hypothetical protein